LVRSAVNPADAQKKSRDVPAATAKLPAADTHDGSTASFNVIPVNAVSPGLVTVIRQNAVDPDAIVVAGAHGPVAEVQSATTVDVHTCFNTDTENTFAVADDPGDVNDGVPGGEPAGGGTTAAAVFVVSVVIASVEQKNATDAPAARPNVPAAVTHDGSPTSVNVMPARSTVDGFVTVIRQNAVDPDGTVVDATHGPVPDWQSATTVEVHTCFSTDTPNTSADADVCGVVNGGVPAGDPTGGGTVAVAVFVVSAVTFAVEHRIAWAPPGARSNAPSTHDGSAASASVTPVRATVPGLVTMIRQNAVPPAGIVVVAAHGPVPD
jgi:hypothetical protein